MEGAGVEIYAEMIKYSLFFPDLIRSDKTIIGGINEVFSAIQGKKVDIGKLREIVKNPSKEILERNASEKILIEELKTGESASSEGTKPLSPEEEELARKQQEEFEKRERAFSNLVLEGEIPEYLEIDEPERSIVTQYAKLYSQIVRKYPTLIDTLCSQYDERFDPELNIWEIREIEWGMGTEVARTITGSTNLDSQTIKGIQDRIPFLQNFVDSSAF
jgi:hypothetical protein